MNWIQKIWPRRAKAKSKPGLGGALAPSYGQDLQHPDELINRANKRALKGDWDGAIADFDAAIDLNPARATTFYNRGYLNNLAGNHGQALQDCTEAISLLPDYDEAFYQRGLAHQELGNIDAATVDFTEVLRLNPFSIKAYYKRASCYAARDDVQGAVADYTQAILRVPKDANAYLQRGIFLTKLQEYRTAVEDFSSALSFNPKSADAYYHRGYCYAELGEKEKATQDFNQAMLYDPSQRVADYNRSYALGILKDTKNLPPAPSSTTFSMDSPSVIQEDEAIVLSLNSEDPTILTTDGSKLSLQEEVPLSEPLQSEQPDLEVDSNISVSRSASQRTNRSPHDAPVSSATQTTHEDFSAEALSLQDSGTQQMSEPQVFGALVRQTDVEALFALAQNHVASRDFEAAIVAYSEIVAYEPDNARAYLERGRSFNAIGLGDDAAADLDTAVSLAKQKSLNLMKDYSVTLSDALADLKGGLEWESHPSSELASSQSNNQAIEDAILKYSKAIHRNPLDVHAYFERAKSRALLGDLEGAIADYTRTISLDDKYRDAYYKRGMLLAALGDTESATQDMNKAILRKPLLPAAITPPPQSTPSPLQSPEPPPEPESMTVKEAIAHQNEMLDDIPPSRGEDVEPPKVVRSRPVNISVPNDSQPSSNEMQVLDDFDVSRDTFIEAQAETDEAIPTYFSDLVLEPCNHEGNDPAHHFCIHCGQPIHPNL